MFLFAFIPVSQSVNLASGAPPQSCLATNKYVNSARFLLHYLCCSFLLFIVLRLFVCVRGVLDLFEVVLELVSRKNFESPLNNAPDFGVVGSHLAIKALLEGKQCGVDGVLELTLR